MFLIGMRAFGTVRSVGPSNRGGCARRPEHQFNKNKRRFIQGQQLDANRRYGGARP
jgi:hypothetical protein